MSPDLDRLHRSNLPGTKFIIAIAVAAVTFIVFLPSLRNEFVWDDNQYVYDNLFIRSLDVRLLKSAWGFHAYNWHPLTWFSHAFDLQKFMKKCQLKAGGERG